MKYSTARESDTIEKLANVVIVVNDQAKALDYYTRVLGMEKRTDMTPPGSPRWLTVAPKGQDLEISLFKAGSYPDPSGAQFKLEAGKGPQWTLKTSDCKKDFEELKFKGVKFDQAKPDERPWGTLATFADPDGNRFALLQPPSRPAW